MAETSIGLPIEGGAVVFAKDTPVDVAAMTAKASSYCGECGSWGAHGARCVCCGYDFHADPVDGADLD